MNSIYECELYLFIFFNTFRNFCNIERSLNDDIDGMPIFSAMQNNAPSVARFSFYVSVHQPFSFEFHFRIDFRYVLVVVHFCLEYQNDAVAGGPGHDTKQ